MNARKVTIVFWGVLLLLLSGVSTQSTAQVSVDVHIGPPPVYRIPAPPPVVVIPGTYVYAVPDIAVDILFYQGYWYRPHGGHWFRAGSYNGPWTYMESHWVPRPIIELPPDYRRVPPGYRRIPYGQFKRSWAGWQRDRYWDRDREWREGGRGRPEERGREFREERREGHEERGGGEGHGRGPEGHGRH
jgi:hypothetical protein